MKTYNENEALTFKTTDSRYEEYNGQTATVTKVYGKPDWNHDRECLPMYDVKLASGKEIHVFHDELNPKNQ